LQRGIAIVIWLELVRHVRAPTIAGGIVTAGVAEDSRAVLRHADKTRGQEIVNRDLDHVRRDGLLVAQGSPKREVHKLVPWVGRRHKATQIDESILRSTHPLPKNLSISLVLAGSQDYY